MKPFRCVLSAVLAVLSGLSTGRAAPVTPLGAEALPAKPTGCVVFRREVDGNPVAQEYIGYKTTSEYIDVTGVSGNVFRVFAAQGPIFIPYPSDTFADPKKTPALIQEARKVYPDLGGRLAGIEQAWAARPLPAVAAGPSSQSVQSGQPTAASPFPSGTVVIGGKKLTGVTVTRVQADGLTVSHDEGIAKIPFDDLPETVRKLYRPPSVVRQQAAKLPGSDPRK